MVFQHFALFPHRNVIDNVGYGLNVGGVDKSERDEAAMKPCRWRVSNRTPAISRANSPAAANSGSASPEHWLPIPTSC